MTLILKSSEVETGLKRKFSDREPKAMITMDLFFPLVMDGHTDRQGTDPMDKEERAPNWQSQASMPGWLFISSEKLG